MTSLSGISAYTLLQIIIFAYLIGCANSAYYLTRILRKQDIRNLFSRNAGATNAGRVLGKWAFITVTALDIIRGAAAVALAVYLYAAPSAAGIALLAVVIGHIHPVQLGFRGGKGAAPLIGGALLLALPAALSTLLLCSMLYLLTRRKHLAAFISFGVFPVELLLLHTPLQLLFPQCSPSP